MPARMTVRASDPPPQRLIPRAAGLIGDDPIFALNAEASRRIRAGEDIVNSTLGALLDDEDLQKEGAKQRERGELQADYGKLKREAGEKLEELGEQLKD